jgi:hypothetical protein
MVNIRTANTSMRASVSTYIQSPSSIDPKEILSPVKQYKVRADLEAPALDSMDLDEKSPHPITRKLQIPYVASFISAFRTPESSRQMAKLEMDSPV